MLETFFDNHHSSADPDIQQILTDYIVPLLSLSIREWVTFDPTQIISPKIVEPLSRLSARDSSFLARHLLRIEDELNELGLLYISRVASSIHLETMSGTIALIAIGIAAIGFSYILPSGAITDLIVVNITMAMIAFTVLELLLILNYLQQVGREEQPEDD